MANSAKLYGRERDRFVSKGEMVVLQESLEDIPAIIERLWRNIVGQQDLEEVGDPLKSRGDSPIMSRRGSNLVEVDRRAVI